MSFSKQAVQSADLPDLVHGDVRHTRDHFQRQFLASNPEEQNASSVVNIMAFVRVVYTRCPISFYN